MNNQFLTGWIKVNIYVRIEIKAQEFGGVAFVNANSQLAGAGKNADTIAFIGSVKIGTNAVHGFATKFNRKLAAVANGIDTILRNICYQVAVMVYMNYVAG